MTMMHLPLFSTLLLTLPLAMAQAAPSATPAEPTLPMAGDENHAAVAETAAQRNERMQWWRDAKFGMFIHWGLYSGLAGEWKGHPGGSEWIQKNVETDTETYAREALPLFLPRPEAAEEWANLAAEAGCRYAVFTTKHHEGFALFDTATTDYNVKKTKGVDMVRAYVEAMRSHNIRVGFYHSVLDWHHPSYDYTINPALAYPKNQAALLEKRGIPRDQEAYQRYLHAQVRELLSNYGKIDVIWWDYSQDAAEGKRAWEAPALIEMCRRLQPGIIMNNRLYSYSGLKADSDVPTFDWRCGDFMTPEQRIPAAGFPGIDWESCMTVGDKWGYNRYDTAIKSPETLIRRLVECTAKGGNLLLNINPTATGKVPEAVANSLRAVGAWLRVCGEGIYGTRPVPDLHLPKGCHATQKNGNIYIFLPPLPTADGQPTDYELQLDATEIGAVSTQLLGMPDRAVPQREETHEEAPTLTTTFIIPAEAWKALEVPVLKLGSEQ